MLYKDLSYNFLPIAKNFFFSFTTLSGKEQLNEITRLCVIDMKKLLIIRRNWINILKLVISRVMPYEGCKQN